MTDNQEFYLLQVKLSNDGEWWSCRNGHGNIIVFLNDFDAVAYSRTDEYQKLNFKPVRARIIKNQIMSYAKEDGTF